MKKIFYGWRIVAALSVVLILGTASAFYTVSVFLEPIEQTLGWTKTQISLGFTIAALTSAAMSPLIGLAISTFGTRKVLLYGAGAVGIALALLSQIRQLWHYYLLMPLMASGISSLGLLTCTSCVSNWFDKRRGTATGVIFAASGTGGMVMVFVASRAVKLIDWRPTYMLLAAILFFIVLPVILIVIRNKPQEMGLEPDGVLIPNGTNAESPTKTGSNFREAARTLPYWLMAVLMLCYGFTFGSMTQHAIALLRSHGVGEPSLFWSLTLGISVLGRLTFGASADRFSKKSIISITWLFHLIGLTSALVLPHFLPLVFAFALFYGAGQGGFSTVFPVRLGELFGTEHFSKLYGTILLFQAIGFSVGTLVFGRIFDTTASYGLAVQMVIVLSFLCVIITVFIHLPKAKHALRAEATGSIAAE